MEIAKYLLTEAELLQIEKDQMTAEIRELNESLINYKREHKYNSAQTGRLRKENKKLKKIIKEIEDPEPDNDKITDREMSELIKIYDSKIRLKGIFITEIFRRFIIKEDRKKEQIKCSKTRSHKGARKTTL